MGNDLLPPKLRDRLEEFMKESRTGKVELNVKDGSIQTWNLNESGKG